MHDDYKRMLDADTKPNPAKLTLARMELSHRAGARWGKPRRLAAAANDA